jgi:hypothetical protein
VHVHAHLHPVHPWLVLTDKHTTHARSASTASSNLGTEQQPCVPQMFDRRM